MTELEIKQYKDAKDIVFKFYELKAQEDRGVRPINYRGTIPRPECNCGGWGCFGCLNTNEEIRKRQGIYG